MAEGFEPSRGRSNNPVPYQLGYATKNWLREQELNLPVLAYETSEPPLLYSRVKVGGDEGSRTLIVRFTRPTLCYPVELHRHLRLVDWEGVKPSQEVCRTSMLSVTSPARKSGGCGWIRTTNLALMRRLLFPFELRSQENLGVQTSVCCFQCKTI